jgi:signal transduction histidine kinase
MSRVELLHDRVDLDGAITEALAELEDEIREARAVVTRERRSGRAAVRGHHATLVQVIANLVANAIKFVGPGVEPRVTVRLEPAGERVRVSVLDNGIGIDPAHRERIFRVFERLHPDDRFAGTGVGLAMVRKAMERLGGTVTCTGRPEGGSCFTIEVPVAPTTVQRDGPSFRVTSPPEPQGSGAPQA